MLRPSPKSAPHEEPHQAVQTSAPFIWPQTQQHRDYTRSHETTLFLKSHTSYEQRVAWIRVRGRIAELMLESHRVNTVKTSHKEQIPYLDTSWSNTRAKRIIARNLATTIINLVHLFLHIQVHAQYVSSSRRHLPHRIGILLPSHPCHYLHSHHTWL